MLNRIKTLTTPEIKDLLNSFLLHTSSASKNRSGIRNFTMAVMMLEIGIRVGELVQITLGDLFWDGKPKNSIIIRAEIAKRHSERTIPTSSLLIDTLEKFMRTGLAGIAQLQHRIAFTHSPADQPLTIRQVQRIIEVAAWKSIGHKINPHMLRHTFASRMMRVTSLRVVQELLGHASIKTTQIYCHPNGDDLRKAIDSNDENTLALPRG